MNEKPGSGVIYLSLLELVRSLSSLDLRDRVEESRIKSIISGLAVL